MKKDLAENDHKVNQKWSEKKKMSERGGQEGFCNLRTDECQAFGRTLALGEVITPN